MVLFAYAEPAAFVMDIVGVTLPALEIGCKVAVGVITPPLVGEIVVPAVRTSKPECVIVPLDASSLNFCVDPPSLYPKR